jgi:hypothetical protein
MAGGTMSGRPKGGYRNTAGERIPGVTTALRQWGSKTEPITWWAFRVGQQNPDAKSPYGLRDAAADVGTAVHEGDTDAAAREILITHDKLATDDQTEKAQRALGGFFQWRDMMNFEVVETEITLISETWQCGGTVDAVGKTPAGLTMIDWKTSGGVYADHLAQLSAYEAFWHEDGRERLDGGINVLRVDPKTGGFEHRWWETLAAWLPIFVACRELHDLDKALKL